MEIRDARPIAKLWDQMVRLDRHSRSGHFMMAISAVDCARWDLKGKALGEPVYRLLGGPTRPELPAYASMLGHSLERESLARKALETRDAGFVAQKWSFRHGPGSGPTGKQEGLEKARAIAPLRPPWLEEPLPPNDLKGFARLKRAVGVPLAAGEHLYTRWGVAPLLDLHRSPRWPSPRHGSYQVPFAVRGAIV